MSKHQGIPQASKLRTGRQRIGRSTRGQKGVPVPVRT